MTRYKKILVTGGAGFIGSHLVDGLVKKGYLVRVLDNLTKQIHPTGNLPDYFNKKTEFIKGDVTKRKDWEKALSDIDAVFHFASAVGVGQSMYEIEHYVKVNSLGTAILLDILANKKHKVKKIIIAASMSSYGEGVYLCSKCGQFRPQLRYQSQLKNKDWQVHCPFCSREVKPLPTSEEAKQNVNSIYAISKKNQEEMVLNIGFAYNIPAVALRYFNVYGSRQSLSNPYNGVVAIFLSRVKNNKPPIINEDGLQTRDFIHIRDVTEVNIKCLEDKRADHQVFNVGTGKPITIKEIAETIINLHGSTVKPDITNRARKGDVRHCYADINKIRKMLGWQPKFDFKDGIIEVANWGKNQQAVDKVDIAMKKLEEKGLR